MAFRKKKGQLEHVVKDLHYVMPFFFGGAGRPPGNRFRVLLVRRSRIKSCRIQQSSFLVQFRTVLINDSESFWLPSVAVKT